MEQRKLKVGEQNIIDNLAARHPVVKQLLEDQEGGMEAFILEMHSMWSESEDYPDEQLLIDNWICDSGEGRE